MIGIKNAKVKNNIDIRQNSYNAATKINNEVIP